MAYTVLARKYRSRTFDEVIGQEPIATTLASAIKAGRIHHGYLFTGARGVGKTSMARILAKALNCLEFDAPTVTPCCGCDICRAIAEGQDVDVLEIDAASNTGVDNIRELRSNTAYRPARSRFKVYIIDEVHMLSTGAFNALLKTLEEPPDHVKFILATTEIQKVPATIQSRCQRFNFRNIAPQAIAQRLVEIVKEEGATAEDAVVQRVARLAAGSMRDALSIVDQLLAVSPKRLSAQVLDELLPPAQDERVFELLRHAAEGDVAAVLTDLDGIVAAGRGLENFCNDAVEVTRTLMLVRACGPDAAMVDLPAGARDDYVELSQRYELSHYVQMIAMLEELRRNVRYSSAGRALTDALMVRLAHMRAWTPIEQLLGQLAATDEASAEKKKPAPQPVAAAASSSVGPASPTRPDAARGVVSQRSAPAAAVLPPSRPTPAFVPDAPPQEQSTPEIPDDYCPAEARTGRSPRESVQTMASVAERAQVEQDPVVRQTLDLFDGIVVKVERRTPIPGVKDPE